MVFDGENGFQPGGDPTAFWPPGYSIVLAGPYWLFGESVAVGRTVNVVAGALTVLPVYFIGRKLVDRNAAALGALIAALLPSLVLWSPVLLSETVFTLIFACAIAALLHSIRPDATVRPTLVLTAGLLIGAAALVRGQALVLLLIAPLWWLMVGTSKRSAGKWLMVLSFGVVLPVVPWTVRNAMVMDSPIVLSANFGYNLRIGHAPYSTGRYLVPQDLWDAKPGITFQERESVFNDLGTDRAIDYAATHPREEVELAGRKIMWLWRPDSDVLKWASGYGRSPLRDGWWEPLRILVDATYIAVLVGGGLALLTRLRSRTTGFVVTLLAAWTGIHIMFFGEPRYHLPALVVLVPLAAAAVAENLARLTRLFRDLTAPLVAP